MTTLPGQPVRRGWRREIEQEARRGIEVAIAIMMLAHHYR